MDVPYHARRKTPMTLRDPVYLVDFAAYKPDDSLKVKADECEEACWNWKHFDGQVGRVSTCMPLHHAIFGNLHLTICACLWC